MPYGSVVCLGFLINDALVGDEYWATDAQVTNVQLPYDGVTLNTFSRFSLKKHVNFKIKSQSPLPIVL